MPNEREIGFPGHLLSRIGLLLVCLGMATGPAWADSLALASGAGQTGLIGQPAAQPLVVAVRDASGAVVAGRSIQWATSNGFTLSTASSVTDANGLANVSFSFGNYGTTGIVASDPVGGTSATAMETSAGSDSITLISGDGQTGQAGSAAVQPIRVEVRDAGGNPVVGRMVQWADITAYTQVDAASSSTDAGGVASMGFHFLSGSASGASTPAGIRATNSIGGQSVVANVLGLGVDFLQITSARQLSGVDGGTSPPIVAHVSDWAGNPIAGAVVTWTVSLPGIFILSSTSTPTDASGNASITAQYVAGTTGDDVITASYNGVSEDVHFFLQSQSHMDVLTADPLTGSPNTPSATPLTIRDYGRDGSPLVGETITWTVVSGNSVPNAPTSVTDATGTATMGFTFGTGYTNFRPEDTRGFKRGYGANATLFATAVELVSGSGQSGTSLTAGASPIVVRVVDNAGNPLAGHTIDWTQFSYGSTTVGTVAFAAPSSITDINGLAQMTFTYQDVGKLFIEATDPSNNSGTAATVITIGTNTMSIVSGANQSGLVGTHGAQPIVVLYKDAVGNPISGMTLDWSVVNAGGNAVLDAATSVTDGSGQASMGFTFGATAAINDIEARDPASAALNAHALETGVGSNAMSLISGNGQTGMPNAAGAQPLVVEVRDAAGLQVAGRTINWSVQSGSATPSAASSVTDGAGRAAMAFSFGSAGSSTLAATDSVSGQKVLFTENATAAQTLASIVSGDGQSGSPGTDGAAPVVIELRDANNQPAAGRSVAWSIVSGPATLGTVSSTTDSSGRASANFHYGTTAGNSVIQAKDISTPNGVLLQATVTSLPSAAGVETLPNLSPEQQVVAVAVDNLCPALANKPDLSPEEADLLARCRELLFAAGSNPAATATALGELLSDTGEAQATSAAIAVGAQVQNVNARLLALRSGGNPSPLAGLRFTAAGGTLQLTSLLEAMDSDEKKPVEPAGFSRWGFFATGNIGRGEADANGTTPAYDFDIEGLTAGVDYRQRDNWIYGLALGFTRQDTDLAGGQGSVGMTGWSVSAYSTYSLKNVWYIDGVATLGRNRFDLDRRISYSLPGAGGPVAIDQMATGRPDGSLFSAALTFGGDFHRRTWGFGPYGQVVYSRMGFASYEESMLVGPGSGLGLAVDARSVTSLTGILGSRLTWTHSADWGVFVPTLSLEWNHEFKSDPDSISARFIHDPTQTAITLSGAQTDADYFRFGIGLSLVLKHGRSGFFLLQHLIDRQGQSQDNLSLGIRIEF